MSSAIVPLLRGARPFKPLLERHYSLVDYRTTTAEYETKADLPLVQSEAWILSLYVRISESFAGTARVIVWDSNNATGNPAATAGSQLPDQRTVDSPALSGGDVFFWEPPLSFLRFASGQDDENNGLQINLAYHCELGYRVQVVDLATSLPLVNLARVVTTYAACPFRT
jgi:hypothetical protein